LSRPVLRKKNKLPLLDIPEKGKKKKQQSSPIKSTSGRGLKKKQSEAVRRGGRRALRWFASGLNRLYSPVRIGEGFLVFSKRKNATNMKVSEKREKWNHDFGGKREIHFVPERGIKGKKKTGGDS